MKLRKLNWTEKKTKIYDSTKIKLYGLREEAKKEQKGYLLGLFFCTGVLKRCNRNHFDDAIFLFAWSFASLVFQIVIPRVSVEPVYIAVVSNVFWFCFLFRQNFQ